MSIGADNQDSTVSRPPFNRSTLYATKLILLGGYVNGSSTFHSCASFALAVLAGFVGRRAPGCAAGAQKALWSSVIPPFDVKTRFEMLPGPKVRISASSLMIVPPAFVPKPLHMPCAHDGQRPVRWHLPQKTSQVSAPHVSAGHVLAEAKSPGPVDQGKVVVTVIITEKMKRGSRRRRRGR